MGTTWRYRIIHTAVLEKAQFPVCTRSWGSYVSSGWTMSGWWTMHKSCRAFSMGHSSHLAWGKLASHSSIIRMPQVPQHQPCHLRRHSTGPSSLAAGTKLWVTDIRNHLGSTPRSKENKEEATTRHHSITNIISGGLHNICGRVYFSLIGLQSHSWRCTKPSKMQEIYGLLQWCRGMISDPATDRSSHWLKLL